jgi:hypothetical protein
MSAQAAIVGRLRMWDDVEEPGCSWEAVRVENAGGFATAFREGTVRPVWR